MGNGTVDAGTFGGVTLVNLGEIAPGASAGALAVTGNFRQGTSGVLSIELGGESAAAHDVLTVSGTAALGGRLQVTLLDGFRPQPQQRFEVMRYASASGDFAEVVLPAGERLAASLEASAYALGVEQDAVVPVVPEQQVLVLADPLQVPTAFAAVSLDDPLAAHVTFFPRSRGACN